MWYQAYKIIQRVVLLFLVLTISHKAAAQSPVAVRNNLIYDLTGTPNLGADFRVSSHWTLGMTAGYRPWPTDDNATRKLRHLLIAPELRYWNDSTFYKSYWGLNPIYSHYNVSHVTFPFGLYKDVRDHRMEGDLFAIGVFYGRTWRLNRFFRLEGELGVALGYAWAKKYDCTHCGTYYGKDNKPFAIPKLTLNLVYQKAAKPVPPVKPPVVEPVVPQLVSHPVEDNTGKAGILQTDNPVLEHISHYRPYDRTRILRKEKGTLYVHFPLNQDVLIHDFRNNADVLDRIVSITRQVMADTTSTVSRIQIIGLASIEGPVDRNERLAEGRAEALKRYIQQHVPTPDALYDMAYGGEAWTELRDQINDIVIAGTVSSDTIAALRQALNVIDTENDLNRREQRLRQLAGGRTYAYIQQHLLADQRNSGYLRIYYDYVPDTRAAVINQASELMQHERYAEALQLLQGVKDDPRAWNALGVALWHTGSQTAALDLFRRAAEQGNADARENLRQLNK